MIMNLLTSSVVRNFILRHVATAVGAYLVNKGIVTSSGLTELIGALTVLASVAHSAWDKRDAIKADITAEVNKIMPPKVGLLIAIASLALATGCANTQVVNATKGTGLTLDLPIGYNGANLFQISLKAGQFDNVTAVQPVSTNKVYAPSFSVVSTTRGNLSAPTIGGTNNGTAIVGGGDKFTLNAGSASSSETNSFGVNQSQANQ